MPTVLSASRMAGFLSKGVLMMNDILFGNNNRAIIKRLARRNFYRERQRNLFAIIALALTSFMIATTFSIGFSYFETYQMQQIRLMGTTANVGITNVTEDQLIEIEKIKPCP